MKPIYAHFAGALALSFAIAACVPKPVTVPPVSRPAPTPTPTPTYTPPPVQQYDNWMDAPRTAGDWSYSASGNGTRADYGTAASEPRFTMGCRMPSRQVMLVRHGITGASPTSMVIRTETATRALGVTPSSDSTAVSAALTATDPLLDAMAFSKGRFAVEAAGVPTLYLPSWAEVSRIIEDCR